MLATIIISAVLLAVVALALRQTIRDHKAGGCEGSCGGCSIQGQCHR